MENLFVIACVLVDLPLFFFIGKMLYADLGEFFEGIFFWLTPDIVSMFRGEFWDDCWAEVKLFVFAGACVGVLVGEYFLYVQLFFV